MSDEPTMNYSNSKDISPAGSTTSIGSSNSTPPDTRSTVSTSSTSSTQKLVRCMHIYIRGKYKDTRCVSTTRSVSNRCAKHNKRKTPKQLVCTATPILSVDELLSSTLEYLYTPK